jgi:hypothetical protein
LLFFLFAVFSPPTAAPLGHLKAPLESLRLFTPTTNIGVAFPPKNKTKGGKKKAYKKANRLGGHWRQAFVLTHKPLHGAALINWIFRFLPAKTIKTNLSAMKRSSVFGEADRSLPADLCTAPSKQLPGNSFSVCRNPIFFLFFFFSFFFFFVFFAPVFWPEGAARRVCASL